MTDIKDFLLKLFKLDIKISTKAERLVCDAPKGALTLEIREELTKRKTEILQFLQQKSIFEQAIQPISRNNELPISFAQQRLWFLYQLEGKNPTYNLPAAVRLEGTVNLEALEKSWCEILQRHETLRTTFSTIKGKPVLEIHQLANSKLPLTNLQDFSPEEQKIEIQRIFKKEAQHPFDLSTVALFRIRLLQLDANTYILLLNIHHIIFDGWSAGVLIQELSILYDAFSQGKSSPLPPLPIQYVDFAHWQKQWLTGEYLDQQVTYWKKQLANCPSLLELPTDHPRPAVQTFKGASLPVSFSQKLTEQLKKLSQQTGITLFMTLLSAFATLLYRYSGQDDIVIGCPIANRTHSQIESLIGFFVNTLGLRLNLEDNPPFKALLQQAQRVALEAYAHQDIPFERLIEELNPERNLSQSPLFQVAFALQNAPRQELKLAGINLTLLELQSVIAKFDLSLLLTENEQGLTGILEYNTDLFERSTIERIIKHFQTLLQGVVENPQLPIHELPLLTETEKKQLIAWNKTTTDYPRDKTLVDLFEEQVDKTPNSIAVIFEEKQLTYQELNDKANQLAHYLQSIGIKPEKLVGICLERSLEMVIGLFGILKAGGAYVPLDPTYPAARLSFMLEDAQVGVLLIQSSFKKFFAAYQNSICLDSDWEMISQYPHNNMDSGILSKNLAYVIYTSGSTGKPKGTMNTHGGIYNRLLWMQEAYQLTSNDQVLQKTPFSFDVSVWEFFWPLLNGAHLVIAKPGGHKDSEYLVKLIKQQNITTLHFVPSMLQIFIQEPDLENCYSLKRVICSGEALPFELQERFFAYLPTVELHNLYGPTEAAVDVTYWQCQQDSHLNNVPIGRPIANIQIYILDPYLQHVPIGVYGELHIAGVGLARGYLNRSDLTQEKFIKNPFSEGRLYKTGDLARYLPDGNIEYLSRIDNQVKIRGFRIELGEIETELTQYTGVLETVVRVQEDSHQQRYIVAYVVLETQSSVSIDELRLFLNEKLPDYMVPAIFLILDALPLTHHGKIDYRALPIPESARSTSSAIFAAPRLLEEELLAEIWGNVLDLEQIGIYDNFFDLGGNSIRSIQIIAQAKEVGLVLSLQQLFQHQTIYELARLIHKTENNYSPTPHIEAFGLISDEERLKLPKNVENAYPLATLQAGMLFHSKYNPETSIYHDVFSYYLKAPFEPQMLRKAIKLLIKRHPVLRTSFATLFKEPLQLVHQEVDVPLSIEDLCHLSKFEQEKAVKAWIEAEKKESFDWTHPPLLRFQIHRRSNDSFNLTLSFHHAILDGWSVASLITELFQQYFVLLGHNISILESQNLTFCDFIALERLTLESKECRQYWLETLQDFTVLTLPRWPVSCSVSQVGLLEVPLSLEISNSLKQLARDARVPIKNVLLAAHLKVLSVLSNKTDILTGLVSNGRPEETGGERVLGLFLNTLPCRIQLRGGTWMDLVQETFKIERNALPYRRFPLAEIQRMLESGDALFETVFNFTHFHVYQNVLVLEGVEVLGGEIFEETNFTFAANFSLDLLSNQVALSLNYDASEFCVEQINAISGYYIEALSAMATQPSARYENHSLLSQQEQRKLLVDWNNTRTDYPKDLCMHQLFEMQVEKTPNAIAVVFENQQLTYQELNCKANQLAHYLQTLDIKPDILVGIYLKRSLEMVIGLLGILKAGGAYLSLDPAYPVARLAFMLEDAQIPVLLTQSNLIDSLPNTTAQKVCLDAKADTLSQLAVDNPSTGVLPSNLVYVIYTSGSTGKPKGVLIEHQGLCNLADAQTKMVGVQSDSRILQFASLNFDGSIWEIVCLCSGAQLNLASSDSLRPGPNLMQLLHEQAITHLTLPPTALAVMPMEKLLDLQYIIVAGEACSPDLIAKWSKGRHFFNGYGPTEATVCATIAECTETQDKISIGRPIPNTQTYILDPHLQLLPIGVPGELHISSVGLARGYLNRPDLTAEKFIGNPFSKDPNSRLYKTGDLARYLPDGNIEYVGRIDNQVKIRGFRIELGEIETVLGQHPSVQDNAVIIQNTLKKDKRVVAYIVQHPKQVIEKTEIRAFLKERLPDYMIPLFFVILEALPLTQTGKIDRQILSQLSVEGSHFSESFVAPRDTLELQLTQIWEDVLNIHPIGIHDNFFELGGHSLLAVSLMAQIEQLVNKTLSLAILFEGATIEQLANILRQQSATQSWSSLVAIQPNGSKPPFFCIPGAAGNVIYFYEFSRLLGTEQPFYGLQAVGLDGESEPHTCIEEMAAHYIKEIQTVQPHGPYLLGGHSLGAFIALEMSFQLQKQGEVVALLTIFDQPIPQLSSAAKTTNWDDAQYLMFLADLIESMLGQKLNIAYDILQSLEKEEQFRYFYERLKKIKAVSQNGNIKEFYGLVKVLQMGFQTGQSYKPEMTLKIPRIALLRTTDTIVERDKKDFFLVDQNEPCWGWDQFSVKTVAIHLVPGDHITMMTPPHVQTLTEKLNICFEQALENN